MQEIELLIVVLPNTNVLRYYSNIEIHSKSASGRRKWCDGIYLLWVQITYRKHNKYKRNADADNVGFVLNTRITICFTLDVFLSIQSATILKDNIDQHIWYGKKII